MYFVFTVLAVCFTRTLTKDSRQPDADLALDKGAVFLKDRDVLLTGDKWTIVVNINLEVYRNLIVRIREILEEARQEIPRIMFGRLTVLWTELDRVGDIVDNLADELLDITKLLPEPDTSFQLQVSSVQDQNRTRRGLIDVVGYTLKYLFGTMDSRDLHNINHVIDQLQGFQQKILHVEEHQLTWIKTLDQETHLNAQNTIKLAEVLRDSISNFSIGLSRVQTDVRDVQQLIKKQTTYSAMIREVEMAVFEIKTCLAQTLTALDMTSLGKLSTSLIRPHNLSDILQQVSLKLTSGTSMITTTTVEDMYIYYDLATVHAAATSDSIRLFIDIPLKAADRHFELYRLHPLPFFHKTLQKHMVIDIQETYLAVSEDRQFFTTFSDVMLSKCVKSYFTICPSDYTLYRQNQPSCAIALFLGKAEAIREHCSRLILNHPFPAVWIRSPDHRFWVYSLYQPTEVTLRCYTPGFEYTASENKVMNLKLENTGIISNSSTCYIHSESFKLFPHSSGRSEFNLRTNLHIVLPDIKDLLNSDEENVLINKLPQAMSDEAIMTLNTVIAKSEAVQSRQNFDVSGLTSELKSKPNSSEKATVNVFLITIVALMTLTLLVVVFKRKLLSCFQHARQRYSVLTDPRPTPRARRQAQRNEVAMNLDELNEEEVTTSDPDPKEQQAASNRGSAQLFVRH